MKSRAKKKNWKVRKTPGRARSKKPALSIPPILLEGDEPTEVTPAEPGQRYTIRPTPSAESFQGTPRVDLPPPVVPPAPSPPAAEPQWSAPPAPAPEPAPELPASSAIPQELPEAYGTKRLLLAPRDPNWFYAHWDFTREQLQEYNQLSVQGHLVLRLFQEARPEIPCSEIHVHPESRNWFVRINQPGSRYVVELGYYSRQGGAWETLATSAPARTPAAGLSEDTSVEFQTLAPDLPFTYLVKLATKSISQNPRLVETLRQLRAEGLKGLPESAAVAPERWTPERERALTDLLRLDESRRMGMSSAEIPEAIQRLFRKELGAVAPLGLPEIWSGVLPAISSPVAGMEQKQFWFNINAELIVYGATEPDARVTIGERVVKLRPDGTFSYRFALPDGNYTLAAKATAADGSDSRSAALQFSRATQYRGEVGAHSQAPTLKPPLAQNVA